MPKEILRCAVLSIALLAAAATGGQQEPRPAREKPSDAPLRANTKPQPRVVQDLSGFELTDPEKLKQETMFIGATRGFGGGPPPLEALAPLLGKVYSTRPVFIWSYSGTPSEAYFCLADDSGRQVLKAPLKPEQRTYALAGVALEASKTYRWHVDARSDSGEALTFRPVGFIVVSEAERHKIAAVLARSAAGSPYEDQLTRARVFREFRLWYDTVSAYTDLIARYPAQAELYEERGMIYAQIPASRNLSDSDFARADALKVKSGEKQR